MEVKNVMEELVFESIDKNIGMLQCCSCPQCKADIAACVLNHLPPRYVATEKGKLFTKVEQMGRDMKTEIMVQVIRAAEIVRKSPRHLSEDA